MEVVDQQENKELDTSRYEKNCHLFPFDWCLMFSIIEIDVCISINRIYFDGLYSIKGI